MLTQKQQELVCKHLGLVDDVIHYKIKRDLCNPDYSYDDLYQWGCVGLCKAAGRYDEARMRATFETYAKRAIYTEIVEYCRGINLHADVGSLDKMIDLWLVAAEQDPEKTPRCIRPVEEQVDILNALEQLRLARARYTGTALKGVISMELKLRGLSGTDIAALYNVQTNHVSAWIARARSKLRADRQFMALVS